MAVLFHYFFLATFSWLMNEAFNLYIVITYAAHSHGDQEGGSQWRYYILGWSEYSSDGPTGSLLLGPLPESSASPLLNPHQLKMRGSGTLTGDKIVSAAKVLGWYCCFVHVLVC